MMIESKAHAALPEPRPTHWRQRWQIGTALAVDDFHFVTQCPCAKQKNSSTDAAAIAAELFCVPFIESPPRRLEPENSQTHCTTPHRCSRWSPTEICLDNNTYERHTYPRSTQRQRYH